jgi:hypothetical protein
MHVNIINLTAKMHGPTWIDKNIENKRS